MSDLGTPQSYLTFTDGTTVLSADGAEVGTVKHVLAAEDVDIFDGLIVDTSFGTRFVDARFVEGLYERGAVLADTAPPPERLPEPSENPPAITASPDTVAGSEDDDSDLSSKLRRAWDYLSGRY